MCFFELFPIFPWLWKKTKKTDGKIEKNGFYPSLQNTMYNAQTNEKCPGTPDEHFCQV